jgi:hypothetical protein
MIIVLVTTGKHESVDTAKVVLFFERFQAEDYVKGISTGKRKYWTKAEIVDSNEVVELCQPLE